jgi:hypothetical protein
VSLLKVVKELDSANLLVNPMLEHSLRKRAIFITCLTQLRGRHPFMFPVCHISPKEKLRSREIEHRFSTAVLHMSWKKVSVMCKRL